MDIFSDPEIKIQFWGSFFAALFALVTFAITQSISSRRRRNKVHYDFLVSLEAKLNHHLSHIYPIIYIIEGVQKAAKKGNLSFNSIDSLMIQPIGEYHNLLDIELKNDVFNYDRGLETLNSDLVNLSETYSEFRSAIIIKQLSINEFKNHFPSLPFDLLHLIISWEEFVKATVDVLVKTRLMIKRDRSKILGLNWLFISRLRPLKDSDIKAETINLNLEMEKMKKQSKQKIENIKRRLNQNIK